MVSGGEMKIGRVRRDERAGRKERDWTFLARLWAPHLHAV